MDRYCGLLKRKLTSHTQPWSNLNKFVLQTAYLSQLKARYDLSNELTVFSSAGKDSLSRNEHVYPDCKSSVFYRS
jgi:hypothetical protein